jgi:hypothetical protein
MIQNDKVPRFGLLFYQMRLCRIWSRNAENSQLFSWLFVTFFRFFSIWMALLGHCCKKSRLSFCANFAHFFETKFWHTILTDLQLNSASSCQHSDRFLTKFCHVLLAKCGQISDKTRNIFLMKNDVRIKSFVIQSIPVSRPFLSKLHYVLSKIILLYWFGWTGVDPCDIRDVMHVTEWHQSQKVLTEMPSAETSDIWSK